MVLSRTNRNFLVAYILLVGLPLLGLAGVLRTGRGLRAPISVDGTWKVETTAQDPAAPCVKTISAFQNSVVTISQSGKDLVLSLNNGSKASGSGAIDGTTVSAVISQPEASLESTCALTLTASVDPKAEPRAMSGTMSVSGCPSCSPVTWRAVREARPVRKGIH